MLLDYNKDRPEKAEYCRRKNAHCSEQGKEDSAMSSKMTIIMPSDYFKKDSPDESFRLEYEALQRTGFFRIILFDYDKWMASGELIFSSRVRNRQKAIYRGWMMKPDRYEEFYSKLEENNILLINDPADYETMHCFVEIYPVIKKYTPEMITYPEGSNPDIKEIRGRFDRFMIKDYVKSVKGTDFPPYFLSSINQEDLDRRICEFRERRGALFTGGICIKEYVKLKVFAGHTNEYRVFYANGNVLSVSRNSLQPVMAEAPPRDLVEYFSCLPSPFYTVDFAQKEDDSWIIIETGDGQVSGLSEGQDAEAFFRQLYHALTKVYSWRWCLTGNIVEEREYGEKGETRKGTKLFSPGTRVYIAPAQWGDGFENVVVIGKPRGKRHLAEYVMPARHICNFRIKKVYDPRALSLMALSTRSWWEDSEDAHKRVEKLLESINNNRKTNSK